MASRRQIKKQNKNLLKRLALQKVQLLDEENLLQEEIKEIKKKIQAARTTLQQLKEINDNLNKQIQKVQGLNSIQISNQLMNAQRAGITEAEKSMTSNWKSSQVKVAEAIGAMKALYEAFDTPYYTSGELIDLYDQIYVKGEIPELTYQEETQVVKGLQDMGFKVDFNEPDPINNREEFIQKALSAIFGG